MSKLKSPLLVVSLILITFIFTLIFPTSVFATPINNTPGKLDVIASGQIELLNLESYDFVTGEKGFQAGGDLYVLLQDTSCYQFEIWANFPPQKGGLYLFSGFEDDLAILDPEDMGFQDDEYDPFCVELFLDGVYVYKRHAQPGAYIIFRVDQLSDKSVTLTYVVLAGSIPVSEVPQASSDESSLPDTFLLPAGQFIDTYDVPGGEASGSFQIELFLTIIDQQDGFLLVSWTLETGTFQTWVKADDVMVYIRGEYTECPFVFVPSEFTPTTFPTPDGSPPQGVVTMAALVDMSSEPVTMQQAETMVHDASDILFGFTGFVIQMTSFETVEFTQEPFPGHPERDRIAYCYVTQKGDLPDSLTVFTYGGNDFAKDVGGYSFVEFAPLGFTNHFTDAQGYNDGIYIIYTHYSHRYAECGYDGEDAPISSTSIGGECRNRPGTACVQHNGYSMCTTAVNNLYASTPGYFGAVNIIHELFHPFGFHGNYDHFGATECTNEMRKLDSAWSPDPDLLERAEQNAGLCPYIPDIFVAGYQP